MKIYCLHISPPEFTVLCQELVHAVTVLGLTPPPLQVEEVLHLGKKLRGSRPLGLTEELIRVSDSACISRMTKVLDAHPESYAPADHNYGYSTGKSAADVLVLGTTIMDTTALSERGSPLRKLVRMDTDLAKYIRLGTLVVKSVNI